jgi:hypothetical protein
VTKLRSVVIIVWLVIAATLAQPGLGTTHSLGRDDSASVNAVHPSRMKLNQLEHRLGEIDDELSGLAIFSLNTGVGSVGYRSLPHDGSASEEWIQIDLGQETPIDQIVLVPAIWRDTIDDFTADGFPLEFSIVAGTSADPDGTVVASYSVKDHLLPRIAPVVVSCEGTTASWVRLEVNQLSRRDWDGKYILQLSEILVFSGAENVALRRPVRAASTVGYKYGARKKRYVVDGFILSSPPVWYQC